MAGSEKLYENKIKAFLKKEGIWYIKYWGGAEYTKAGIPDILACVNGIFFGIEVKSATGKPSELQLFTIEEIKKSGGVAFVLYPKDFERFKSTIKAIKNHQTSDYSMIWDFGVIKGKE